MQDVIKIERSAKYDAERWNLAVRWFQDRKWHLLAFCCVPALAIEAGFVALSAVSGNPFPWSEALIMPLLIPFSLLYFLLIQIAHARTFRYLSIDKGGVIRPGIRLLGLWFWGPTHCEVAKDRLLPNFYRLTVFHHRSGLSSIPVDDLAQANEFVRLFDSIKHSASIGKSAQNTAS